MSPEVWLSTMGQTSDGNFLEGQVAFSHTRLSRLEKNDVFKMNDDDDFY